MVVPFAQLSCEECQQRKTKCSKTVPCSACVKAGIACTAVQRHRLPRGRGRAQKRGDNNAKALVDRIGRLEAVVSQLQQNGSADHAPSNVTQDSSMDHVQSSNAPAESFVARDFWLELSDVVADLKDVLEHRDDNEDPVDELVSPLADVKAPVDSDTIIFGLNSRPPASHPVASPEAKEWLLTIYKDRVDAIFKPLHWPSALSQIRSSQASLSAETQALEFSVYFTAACSLLDHERNKRHISLERLRQTAEGAFVHAGLLTTTSIIVLQAFVIYLAGLRAIRASAQQWTLTATAIRLASAQGIPTHFRSSFEGEIQRRLWFCIGVLDLQSAFDRGSQPLLRSSELTSWPLNINDSEMSSTFMPSFESSPEIQYTEMLLSLVIYQAGTCHRRLTEIGLSAVSSNSIADFFAAGNEQLGVLDAFEHQVKQLSDLCCESASPMQQFTVAVANESLVAMQLLLHRPLYRRTHSFVSSEMGPVAYLDVLTTATEVLERSQMKRTQPEFAQWAWFAWVKWYALAIVLAELCVAQGPQADHAWEVSQRSFDDYAEAVAYEQSGTLWKPIVRLMRRVKAIREQRSIPTSLTSGSTSLSHNGDNTQSLPLTVKMQHASTFSEPGLEHYDHEKSQQTSYTDRNMPEYSVDSSEFHWNLLIDDLGEFDICKDLNEDFTTSMHR